MLDVLRASKGGIITWFFLGAIIIVFVISFGPGSLSKGNHGCGGAPIYAAKVNGTTIPLGMYELQLRQTADLYRGQYGDEFVNVMMPQLAEQTLGSLVTRTLLVQEAERRGIQVSEDELKDRVRASPEFQENGRYSRALFEEQAVARFGSTRAYMELLRADLLLQRLDAAFEATVKVPESEVHDTWKRLSDRASLAYVLFPTADVRAEVKVGDADVQAFAAREGARIEKFYQENPARFDQPRKARIRHVLARVEGKDDAAAKKKIEAAVERLKKGEDFAKVAAELSDDENTKSSGGDLGVITAGQVDDEFAKAALALEPGQISGPVKTPSGWHVLKADEVVPARKLSLDTARPEIARELLVNDRTAELQKQKAAAALEALHAGKSVTDLFPEPQKGKPAADGKPAVPEKAASLTLGGKPVVARETGQFPASAQLIPQLNVGGDLLRDAVAAQAGAVLPRAYDTPAGVVVAVVKDRQRPDESSFPKEREMVENQLRGAKAQQLRQAWVAELRSRASVVEHPDALRLTSARQPQPLPEE